MIPKKIHYCWFGGKSLPEDARKCIASWRKYFPDYEIIEWNETNFDVNAIPYTQEAYNVGKYAFVSDYARFKVLYEYGGLYFDTDVEVIKPFDDIIEAGPFMGFEINPTKNSQGYIAPGLGLGAETKMDLYKNILKYYSTLNFIKKDGSFNITDAVVNITTREIYKYPIIRIENGIMKIADNNIYPAEYFNPLQDSTGKLFITPNTHSIHWYSKSWLNESKLHRKLSRLSHRLLGTKFIPLLKSRLKRLNSKF